MSDQLCPHGTPISVKSWCSECNFNDEMKNISLVSKQRELIRELVAVLSSCHKCWEISGEGENNLHPIDAVIKKARDLGY